MPHQTAIHFAQTQLEQVRDQLAGAADTSEKLTPERLSIMSGKVAGALYVYIEATRASPA